MRTVPHLSTPVATTEPSRKEHGRKGNTEAERDQDRRWVGKEDYLYIPDDGTVLIVQEFHAHLSNGTPRPRAAKHQFHPSQLRTRIAELILERQDNSMSEPARTNSNRHRCDDDMIQGTSDLRAKSKPLPPRHLSETAVLLPASDTQSRRGL